MNKKHISLVASFFLATQLHANDDLSSIYVTSKNLKITQKNAAYSTEVYTKKDIQESKSKDVYDFLNTQTSVTLTPWFGNRHTPLIDTRGYGLSNGNLNVVINVNGRRLNSIDSLPQLLSSISVESIEKIEILKGSGSVEYGDGANAGVINIVTTSQNENYVKTYAGSNGLKYGIVSMGFNFDNLIVNAMIDHQSSDGSIEDNSGKKDENHNKNKNINVLYFPTDDLGITLSRTFSNVHTNYAKAISLEDYNSDDISKTSGFTEQYFSSYVTQLGVKYDINKYTTLDVNATDENKWSEYSTGSYGDYDTKSLSTVLNYGRDIYNVVLGYQVQDAQKGGSSNITSKDSEALFISSNIQLNTNILFSLGARTEKVEYQYAPNTGTTLTDDDRLNAYNVGLNYQLDDIQSVFMNYNRSFLTPDTDKFFKWGGGFNEFIEPMKVRTYNVGYSYIQNKNMFKTTLYRSDLTNEIYYNASTFKNTNLEKTHKYGLELFNKYYFNDTFFSTFNYNYIIAKIDEESDGSGAYNGKYLPGVSKHNVNVSLGYEDKKYRAVISHKYKTSAYASNDFDNDNTQKQEAYNKTDLSLSYNYKQQVEFFAKIENLFDESNGLWTKNDSIYVYDFERKFYAGVKVNF